MLTLHTDGARHDDTSTDSLQAHLASNDAPVPLPLCHGEGQWASRCIQVLNGLQASVLTASRLATVHSLVVIVLCYPSLPTLYATAGSMRRQGWEVRLRVRAAGKGKSELAREGNER